MPEPVRRRVRNDPEVTRARILDEAICIMGAGGYHGFAVQDLAARCGLTNGGLLYHFNTKEQLLLQVLRECDRRWEAALKDTPDRQAEKAGSRETALATLRKMMAMCVDMPELERLLCAVSGEALDKSHPAYEYLCDRELRTLDWFAEVLEGHWPDPQSTARHVYALALGLEQQWLRAQGGFDLVAEWDRAIARLLPIDGL